MKVEVDLEDADSLALHFPGARRLGVQEPHRAHESQAVADAQGRVWGGHAAPGCVVRTTAEVLLALLPEWRFSREHDEATGYAELRMREKTLERE